MGAEQVAPSVGGPSPLLDVVQTKGVCRGPEKIGPWRAWSTRVRVAVGWPGIAAWTVFWPAVRPPIRARSRRGSPLTGWKAEVRSLPLTVTTRSPGRSLAGTCTPISESSSLTRSGREESASRLSWPGGPSAEAPAGTARASRVSASEPRTSAGLAEILITLSIRRIR